jgi:hypothetical protein
LVPPALTSIAFESDEPFRRNPKDGKQFAGANREWPVAMIFRYLQRRARGRSGIEDLLGIDVPVIQAPMAGASFVELVAAVRM